MYLGHGLLLIITGDMKEGMLVLLYTHTIKIMSTAVFYSAVFVSFRPYFWIFFFTHFLLTEKPPNEPATLSFYMSVFFVIHM